VTEFFPPGKAENKKESDNAEPTRSLHEAQVPPRPKRQIYLGNREAKGSYSARTFGDSRSHCRGEGFAGNAETGSMNGKMTDKREDFLRKQTDKYLDELTDEFEDNPVVLEKIQAVRNSLADLDNWIN
jgi:hypothetical protein